jgi:hypothetical protein
VAYPWLSLWDKTLDTPKVQRLPAETFKGWVNLLCLANRQAESGRLPSVEDIAFALRIQADDAQRLVDDLVNASLIDRKGKILTMHDWDDHQQTGRTNAERAREYRERKQLEALSERTDERTTSAQPNDDSRTELDNSTEQKKTYPPRAPRRGATLIDFVLPSWIPENDWNDWLAMRRAKRAPTTVGALIKAVKDLEKLNAAGHSPADVLQQSTLRAWTGLFPIALPYVNGKPSEPAVKLMPPPDPEKEKRNDEARRRALNY